MRQLASQCEAAGAPTARKGFDAADLGPGKKAGGGIVHRKDRHELTLRVAAAVLPLRDKLAVNLERKWKLWDAAMSRRVAEAWGHMLRNQKLQLQ